MSINKKLLRIMEIWCSKETRNNIQDNMKEIEEYACKNIKGKSEDSLKKSRAIMNKFCSCLNRQLGIICEFYGFPLNPLKWSNQKPLDILLQVWKRIGNTIWFGTQIYQMHNENNLFYYRIMSKENAREIYGDDYIKKIEEMEMELDNN